MEQVVIDSKHKRQVIDITQRVADVLPYRNGTATVFVQHTTAAITTADLDPGTDLDLLDALEGMIPDLKWRHPHDPAHAPDHLLASILGPAVTVPFQRGRLLLGIWQRIVLVELDGPRQRSFMITVRPLD